MASEPRRFPRCPYCGAVAVQSDSASDTDDQPPATDRVLARCDACGGRMLVQYRATSVQLISDGRREPGTDLLDVQASDIPGPSLGAWWRSVPNRIKWLFVAHLVLALLLELSSDQSQFLLYGQFALLYSCATHLGLWAGSARKLLIDRVILACVASVGLAVFMALILPYVDLDEIGSWFVPATMLAFAEFAVASRFGILLHRPRVAAVPSGAKSLQFSVRQLLAVTTAVAVALLISRQYHDALITTRYSEFWACIGMGLGTAPPVLIGAWAFLGKDRIVPRVLVYILSGELLTLLFFYVIGHWQAETIFIVWVWGVAYLAIVAASLLVIRSCGYRFGRIE